MLSMIPALGLSLRVLDLSSCVALTNRTLQAICTYLTHLSVLRLAWCRELCDWGLLGLEEPLQGTQPRPELEHQASGTKDPCPEPQGPSLLMLRALQELDLTACSKLTDASLAKDTGCHWAGVQAAPGVGCGHVPWHQHGRHQTLPSPAAPGVLRPVPLRGRG